MTTTIFAKTTASIAAWNLATFESLDNDRIKRQADGLRLLDAELVTLVEIKNESHIQKLSEHLTKGNVVYEYSFLEQMPTDSGHDAMHIGVLYKNGVQVTNPLLMPNSGFDLLPKIAVK